MTAVDTAAATVLTTIRDFNAAVLGYQAFRLDARDVRSAGLAVANAHRHMVATPGDLDDVDAYLTANRLAPIARRTTARIVDAHLAGNPDR